MHDESRRRFLKLAAAGAASEAFAAILGQAAAAPANNATGTIRDVEHVVILMQENRSFDHYFGALRGVRGFGDPRPLILPSGRPVWFQPDGKGGAVAPFRLDGRRTSAESMRSLDHSWKGAHARWKNHDAWIGAKTSMTMGHFTREDLPFYYALADAFTVCDAYHCSVFGPTSPNRLFLFTGTNGLGVSNPGDLAIRNPLIETNETADPAHDNALFGGFGWTTYAERLQKAGVSWKVYQEFDNYGDNALAYFKTFRGAGAARALLARGRGCASGSNAQNAKSSRGEHLVSEFAADVKSGRLPAVSWIVAPYILCEHPDANPSYGQALVAQLIAALTANPAVWSKTAFILNYDENDGFFDHMPPALPALGPWLGKSWVSVAGEAYRDEPVGLGPRVPMIVASPWTRGGWVNSQVFDHTSVLRFLEARFGVAEPNISPWRRAVCGDLTSVFDFATPNAPAPTLPDTAAYRAQADAAAKLASPQIPAHASVPRQEPGQRPARALPYDFEVSARLRGDSGALILSLANRGAAGAAFNAYAAGGAQGPWFYTVEAGKRVEDALSVAGGRYDLSVYGANGYLRRFAGRAGDPLAALTVAADYDRAAQALRIAVRNPGKAAAKLVISPRAYSAAPPQRIDIAAGGEAHLAWPIAASAHWYDLEIADAAGGAAFLRRLAGHIETGAPSFSDPAIAAA